MSYPYSPNPTRSVNIQLHYLLTTAEFGNGSTCRHTCTESNLSNPWEKIGEKHYSGRSRTVWLMWLFLLSFDGLIKALRVTSGLLEQLLKVRLAIHDPL